MHFAVNRSNPVRYIPSSKIKADTDIIEHCSTLLNRTEHLQTCAA